MSHSRRWRRPWSPGVRSAGILWVGLADGHIRVLGRINGFSDRRGCGFGGNPEKHGVGGGHIRLHDAQMPDIGAKVGSIIFLCFAPDLVSHEETAEQVVAALPIQGSTNWVLWKKKKRHNCAQRDSPKQKRDRGGQIVFRSNSFFSAHDVGAMLST